MGNQARNPLIHSKIQRVSLDVDPFNHNNQKEDNLAKFAKDYFCTV